MYAKNILVSISCLMISATFIPVASARTNTGKLTVKVNIAPTCELTSADKSLLDFGSVTDLTNEVSTQTSSTSGIEVKCGKGIAYTIGLDGGQNSTAPQDYYRGMKSITGERIPYDLFQDAAHKIIWATTGHVLSAKGTGDVQKFPVYGRIPALSKTPTAGDYSDIVSVIVTY